MDLLNIFTGLSLVLAALLLAWKFDLIDDQTAIVSGIVALLVSIAGRNSSDQTSSEDPRDEPVDPIEPSNDIDSPDNIEREESHENPEDDGDPFDRANDFTDDK